MNNIPPELTLFCILSIMALGSFALWPLIGEKDGWIRAKDRMPTKKDGNAFLVWDGSVIDKAWLGSGSWLEFDNERRLGGEKYITHWRPLPAAPKERKR